MKSTELIFERNFLASNSGLEPKLLDSLYEAADTFLQMEEAIEENRSEFQGVDYEKTLDRALEVQQNLTDAQERVDELKEALSKVKESIKARKILLKELKEQLPNKLHGMLPKYCQFRDKFSDKLNACKSKGIDVSNLPAISRAARYVE